MTATHDLAAAIGDQGAPRIGFRQGTIVEFNTLTGKNVIDVGDALLEDVPVLNVTDAVGMTPGMVVGLLTFQSSWWIIGRITMPGTPDFGDLVVRGGAVRSGDFDGDMPTGKPGTKGWALGSDRLALLGAMVVPVEFHSAFDHGGPFSINTTTSTEASMTVLVPDWADEAAVMVMGMFSAQNQSSSTDNYNGWTRIDGIAGQGFNLGTAVGETVYITVGQAEVINISGRSSFVIDAQVWTSSNSWPLDNTNNASISAMILFRSAP